MQSQGMCPCPKAAPIAAAVLEGKKLIFFIIQNSYWVQLTIVYVQRIFVANILRILEPN